MSSASKNIGSTRVLGVFTLTMINVAAIQSLRNLPVMADVGWASVFFYLIAAIGFFIPCSLVAAELATGWSSTGGIYTWVKEAFGARWGFVAIWLQWIENVIWYPTVLSFTAATIAYLFNPSHAQNEIYILLMVMGMYWFCTLIDLMGMKISGMISSIGVIIGTLLPGALIIILGCLWVIKGNPSHIPFSFDALFPDFSNISNIVFLVGVMLGFAGMEMSAVHAREVEKPQINYPKAIFFSAMIILTVSIFGSLAIAFVVPQEDISLVAGIMQAFSAFFNAYHVPWMTPILASLIAAGAIAMVSTWIVGPSKGLFQTAHEGHIPPIFHKRNRNGMPIAIMIVQGMVVSLLSLAFLFMPTVSSSYWILNALTALLYLLMYMLMFAAAIRLRYTKPHVQRHYRIPGGKYLGMWIVAGIGLVSSAFAFCIGFLPPAQIDTGEKIHFELFLGIGVAVMFVLPLIFYACRKDHWKMDVLKDK
jgi:putative glutamate/gamma-aminobutyrate antiporter